MKFSHSLQFNAVPEWLSKYIAYTTLKKLIYQLQRENLSLQHRTSDAFTDVEPAETLLPHQDTDSNLSPLQIFVAALDAELRKVDSFYQQKSLEIFNSADALVREIHDFEHKVHNVYGETQSVHIRGRNNMSFDTEEDNSFEFDGSPCRLANQPTSTLPFIQDSKTPKHHKLSRLLKCNKSISSKHILLSESRVMLRKRIINMFTTVLELKSFVELNYTGFKKATKKFGKSLDIHIQDSYLAKFPLETVIFMPNSMTSIELHIDSLVEAYSFICNNLDLDTSMLELSVHLREHMVWERNTVWRDMIGLERKTQGASVLSRRGGYFTGEDCEDLLTVQSRGRKSLHLGQTFNFSIYNVTIMKLLVVIFIGITLLIVSPFQDPAQKNCFVLVVCASLLWASEAVPLFVTSLLIPLFIVILGVLKNSDGSIMNAPDLSRYVLLTMWNSVILLLLGGFTLAAALSKFHIAKALSTSVLSRAGTNPPTVLFAVMTIAWFALMWVSNVAAPVLCFSLIQPLLRTLPRTSKFNKALILGIALASNIGGMSLPIASPQNIIAIGAMYPAPLWGEWFFIATPVCVLLLVLIWAFLVVTFLCNRNNTQLVAIRKMDDLFLATQWFIIGVSITTILLWCFALHLEGVFGEMGIISLVPMVIFFGTGLLTTEDFNNYPWNIIVLAMGGTSLGKAVESSRLLATISFGIQRGVEGFLLFGVTLAFGILILVIATFVSHTVAALIIIPLILEIGNDMDDPHPRLLIMASALLCSAAMGLPTLGFPNVTAICMTDDLGKPYLSVCTFITRGVPSSVLAYAVIVTVGFATMKIINF